MDSSVGIVSMLGLYKCRIDSQQRQEICPSPKSPPASYTVSTGDCFPGGKAAGT